MSDPGESAWAPAWSEPFLRRRSADAHASPFGPYDRELAWGDATGRGVRVAIVDSGVEADHPAVGGRLVQSVAVERDGDEFRVVENAPPIDVVGHGTACAGIIHALAPEADLVSVRVLGADNKGSGLAFAHGLDWVIRNDIGVANLSLSSRSEDLYATFHDLVDQAYFRNCLLVCSASNTAGQVSYPSLFASVVSVASHDIPDPWTFFYNPHPPVEFGAWGVNVPVAWNGGGRILGSGNSFATPHIAGIATLIRSKHPHLTPFELKAILAGVADAPEDVLDAADDGDGDGDADA